MRYIRAVKDSQNSRTVEELLGDVSLSVPFIASTEGVKADGFNLKANEWDLSRYDDYGIVLFGHDQRGSLALPIGRGQARFDGNRLMIDVAYDTDDPFAMKIRNKAIKGLMAGSVAWDTYRSSKQSRRRNVLVEFSNVPVPLDPNSRPAIDRNFSPDSTFDSSWFLDDEALERFERMIDATERFFSIFSKRTPPGPNFDNSYLHVDDAPELAPLEVEPVEVEIEDTRVEDEPVVSHDEFITKDAEAVVEVEREQSDGDEVLSSILGDLQ